MPFDDEEEEEEEEKDGSGNDLRPKVDGLLESTGTAGGCGVSCQMCAGGKKTTEGCVSICHIGYKD